MITYNGSVLSLTQIVVWLVIGFVIWFVADTRKNWRLR